MLNEILLSIPPIWLIIIITIGEGILIGVLNSRVKNNDLPKYYMYLSIAAYNLMIGLLLHEVGRVNMEVIYRSHTWEGYLTNLESRSFVMRYFGLLDAILGIIYIVVALFNFLEVKMASMHYGMDRISNDSKDSDAAAVTPSSSNEPTANPPVVGAKIGGKEWVCKCCGTKNSSNANYCVRCFSRGDDSK